MSEQITDVIYHHPGSEGYEDKTTHHVSIAGPKIEEARNVILQFTSAQQIFPPTHQALEKNCLLEFPAHMTADAIETELVQPKMQLDGGKDADLRFHVSKPR